MADLALNEECVCGEKLGQVTITVECRHRYHIDCARRMMRDTCAYCRNPSKVLKKIKKYQMLCAWRYLLEDLPEHYMQYVDGIKLPQVEEMAGWLVGEPDTKQIHEYLESLDEENSDDKHPFVTFSLPTTHRFISYDEPDTDEPIINHVFRAMIPTRTIPLGSIYIELANYDYNDLQIMSRTVTQVVNPIRVIRPIRTNLSSRNSYRSMIGLMPRFPLYRSPRTSMHQLIDAQYIRDIINRIRRRRQHLLN
tara:strand:+ start:18885 stop:19637 length:753 start_codon:yes stop_codon:yes gene_type:complete